MVAAAVLTVAVAVPASAAPHVVQATFYASPTGTGTAACTQADPCSLMAARDKVRSVSSDMTGDIVVNLQGGTYTLASTFQLNEADSGTNGFDIVYRKDPAASTPPVISGGEAVTGFTTGDTIDGYQVYQATVGATVESRQLYVNGVRATRARSDGNPAMAINATATGYRLPLTGMYSTMSTWGNIGDIEVAASRSWKRARYSVASINAIDITMDAAGWNDGATQGSGLAARDMMWIENAYELLNKPGEWYLDRSADTLYYIPLAGQNVATSEFVLGRIVKLVEGAGTLAAPLHNVRLDGLTFSYDGWVEPNSTLGYPDFQGGAVYRGTPPPVPESWSENNYQTPAGVTFTNVQDIAVTNSTFTHMANAALAFGPGSQYNLIDHNTFTDISGNGINIGGLTKADHHPANPASIVKNNVISNNTVTNIGVEYQDNVGIFLGYTQGSDVKHNTVHDLPYTGISMGWGWGYIDTLGTPVARNNVMRGNLVYDVMKNVHDGGAIYTLGSQLGSKVVDNYVHDDHQQYAYLYRDNGSAGFLDTNNVIDKGQTALNTWYFANMTAGGYWNPHDNLAQGNYYTSGMTSSASGSNVVGTNTAVANNAWPAGALDVMAEAGVDGADITPVTPGDVTLSRGKTAIASSTYSPNYDAAKAVDGDPVTRWAQGSGAPDPSWLAVDLEDEYVISGTSTSAYLHLGKGVKYKIEYSTDNNVWSTYIDKTAKFTVPGRDTNAGQIVARYLKITFTATQGQGGSLVELDVFGSPVPPISQGKTATASSTYSAAYDPAKAVDGDSGSRWAQASGAADPSWLKVDLGAEYLIASVNTTAYLPSGLGVKYKVEYSSDNSSWAMYADKTASFSIPGIDTNPGPVIARYLRITLTATQGQGGSLYEFQVYGDPVTELAQAKTATASSTYSPTYSADKAVDGDNTSRWAQASGAPDPSWLTVDLGALHPIHAVNTSAYLHSGLGVKYKIEYSTDNSNWSMYADKTATFSTPGLDTNPGQIAARFLRITLTATQGQGGSIKEFKVYGN